MKKQTSQNTNSTSTTPATGSVKSISTVASKSAPAPLTDAQKQALALCEAAIRNYQSGQTEDFYKLVLACHQIQRDGLYREFATQEAYFKAKLGFSRSHSLRLASMGSLIDRVSPEGDLVKVLASDAHLRPLLKLTEPEQDAVIALALAWAKMANLVECPAKLVMAARTFLNPPRRPCAAKTWRAGANQGPRATRRCSSGW